MSRLPGRKAARLGPLLRAAANPRGGGLGAGTPLPAPAGQAAAPGGPGPPFWSVRGKVGDPGPQPRAGRRVWRAGTGAEEIRPRPPYPKHGPSGFGG